MFRSNALRIGGLDPLLRWRTCQPQILGGNWLDFSRTVAPVVDHRSERPSTRAPGRLRRLVCSTIETIGARQQCAAALPASGGVDC